MMTTNMFSSVAVNQVQRLPGFIFLFLIFCFSPVAARADRCVFPKGTNLTSLVVINENQIGSAAQQVLIATLQGIVARQSGSQIYIVGSSAGYGIWYPYLNEKYGIPFTITSNSWSLVSQFKNLVSGYLLYDAAANSNSVNAATSLCGPFNAIAVDASIEATVRSYGITNRIADLRTRDEGWVWTNYNSLFLTNIVIEQKETINDNLRDYAAMAGAFTFFDGNSPFRNYIMSQMSPDSACLGNGDTSSGENIPISDCSSNGVYTVASDWASDLSTFSSLRDASFYQHTFTNAPPSETNVQYVTFITTDGDNVQWDIGDLAGYFTNAARGQFSMGWTISPTLVDLAPSILRWYFDNSSNGSNKDFFVAGTSGMGYFYPSMYPPSDLAIHVQKLSSFLDRADLDLAYINDFDSFERLDLWNQYLSQPNVAGLFYDEYSLYSEWGGAILFSTNGRPIISTRDLIWAGVEEPAEAIANINSYPCDTSSPDGYTLVQVHVWDETLSDVQTVVNGLASNVRVVTPDAFVKLVRNNVGRKLSYDFATSSQGWDGQTDGDLEADASWNATNGNPAGCLVLNGTNSSQTISSPNSFFWRQIILPPNATTLSFDTGADNDGLLAVVLVPANGTSTVLLNWEQLTATNTWFHRTASLTNYAGQTVFLYFLQHDGGQSSREARYVDNVTILTEGLPIYLPDAPKLLTLTGTNGANLLWRDNDDNESGFAIERSSGTNGLWTEIARTSNNITSYSDTFVTANANYSYRIRSWNAAGYSAYSNVRAVTLPNRLGLAINVGTSVELTWPSWGTNFTLFSSGSLCAGASWTPVPGPATNLSNSIGITLPLSKSNEFFQLRSQ